MSRCPAPEPDASDDGWLPRQFAVSPKRPLRFYLEVGRFEAVSMVLNNRRMRDVLTAKGYSPAYSEYQGDHDHLNWGISLGDALIALIGDAKRK